jgi:hypothetical protein
LAGCGSGVDGPDKSTPSTISWRLQVATSGGAFGARMFLDGEQVYLDSSATRLVHVVDVVRPYRGGDHVLEVEIVSSASATASVYVAACSAQASPGGKALQADGIPWTLVVGERLRLSVSL